MREAAMAAMAAGEAAMAAEAAVEVAARFTGRGVATALESPILGLFVLS